MSNETQQITAGLIVLVSLSIALGAILQTAVTSARRLPELGAKGCHAVVEQECETRRNGGVEIKSKDEPVIKFR